MDKPFSEDFQHYTAQVDGLRTTETDPQRRYHPERLPQRPARSGHVWALKYHEHDAYFMPAPHDGWRSS